MQSEGAVAPSPTETHLLYVLLDSNLPTGGFVASSGLESYAKHGFFSVAPSYGQPSHLNGTSGPAIKTAPTAAMMDFAASELDNYASTTLCFVADSWNAVNAALVGGSRTSLENVCLSIVNQDKYHEATMLSHVARRSSKAQGVAMLTLFSRGLSIPPGSASFESLGIDEAEAERRQRGDEMVNLYKRQVRLGASPGHLAVCWGVITAALGLSLDRSLHLHLFLHARSLLSSAVRLNIIGPYASSQLLLHPMRALIERAVTLYGTTESHGEALDDIGSDESDSELDEWAWTDDAGGGPVTTWPLGEILTGRHDLQHSRIFNS